MEHYLDESLFVSFFDLSSVFDNAFSVFLFGVSTVLPCVPTRIRRLVNMNSNNGIATNVHNTSSDSLQESSYTLIQNNQ